ncbi:hypothetical protein C8J56DRAFT_1063745 [Mycena floridula]|nr:hypothetical protein C8J56DRAFT_1063745 [Mycena floridula]
MSPKTAAEQIPASGHVDVELFFSIVQLAATMTPEEQAEGLTAHLNFANSWVFPDLEPEQLSWLDRQVEPYVAGIKLWKYKLTLEAIYVGFLQQFPRWRHRDESKPRCRAQHISVISRHLHSTAMHGLFEKAGIYDLMQAINPRYPEDIPLDIQISATELVGQANKYNFAVQAYHRKLVLLEQTRPSSFDETIARTTFASFHPTPMTYSTYVDMSSAADDSHRSYDFPPPPSLSMLLSSASSPSSFSPSLRHPRTLSFASSCLVVSNRFSSSATTSVAPGTLQTVPLRFADIHDRDVVSSDDEDLSYLTLRDRRFQESYDCEDMGEMSD